MDNVVVVDKLLAAQAEQAPPDVNIIRDIVALRRFFQALIRQPEMSVHPQDAVHLRHDARAGQVRRLRQVHPAHTVVISQLFQILVMAERPADILRPQPRNGKILLQVRVLDLDLDLFRERFRCGGDLFPDEIRLDALAQARQTLFQFVEIVPLLRIVHHVDDRQNVLFPAVPLQERGAALHQLIKKALVLIPAGGYRHPQRLLPGARAGYHDLPLPKPVHARPCRDFISYEEHRRIAVALFAGKRQLLHDGIGLLNDQPPVFGALCDRVQLRLRVNVILKRRIAKIRLVQLRREVVNFAAVFSRGIGHIIPDRRGHQGFALLPAHNPKDLTKLPPPGLIHNPEDQGNGRPLPQAQLQPPRRQLALVVMAVPLNKPDRVPGQPVIIKPSSLFDPLQDHLIELPHPLPDRDPAGLYLMPVFEDRVVFFSILHAPTTPPLFLIRLSWFELV